MVVFYLSSSFRTRKWSPVADKPIFERNEEPSSMKQHGMPIKNGLNNRQLTVVSSGEGCRRYYKSIQKSSSYTQAKMQMFSCIITIHQVYSWQHNPKFRGTFTWSKSNVAKGKENKRGQWTTLQKSKRPEEIYPTNLIVKENPFLSTPFKLGTRSGNSVVHPT